MEIILRLTPEEYNLVHKGLSKLTIEEGLTVLQKIVRQTEEQVHAANNAEEKEKEDGSC